jgi:hypothetical protein
MDTLYKHQDLWLAAYNQSQHLHLASDPGEYNAVEGAGSSKTMPPTPSDKNFAPPGLLAARRIVYEISMRTQRERDQNHKSAIRSLEASESSWLGNVTRLTEKEPSTLSVAELKALLTVLAAYLAMAPNEECQVFIQQRIARIKDCLSKASDNPLVIVRPPENSDLLSASHSIINSDCFVTQNAVPAAI